jgi:hypothetical protein
MSLQDARKQTQLWWGPNGSADFVIRGMSTKYVVGTTALPARLGGRVVHAHGVSFVSFGRAFANAMEDGWETDPVGQVTEDIDDDEA